MPKISKSVSVLYVRKDDLQKPNSTLASGQVHVKTGLLGPPIYIRRPRNWEGEWEGDKGVWVEFKAVRTFTVKEKRKRK